MDANGLYGLPLDLFVPERGALARALRADGRREAAADVVALRKPSVAAWAVNQLVRTQGRALAELFDAGDALRNTQADVMTGRGDGPALRAAADRERTAVDALVNAARGLLTSEGHELSAAIIDRVADTVHAAALDDGARRRVREGRLERELRHVGLGVGAGADAVQARRPETRNTPTRNASAMERGRPAPEHQADDAREKRAERELLAQDRATTQRVERERARARKAAGVRASEARRAGDRAARALNVAEERRERAAQTLRDADDALAAARAEAEAAADRLRRAEEDRTDT